MKKSPLITYDKKHVWHPFTQAKTAGDPLAIVSAQDAILTDENGDEYIDANSSWWVNTHGHGNEYIQQAIQEQLAILDHVIFAGVTHPKAVELATRICQILPVELEKVFFSDDGSTAVEVALKMAFQYNHNKGVEKKNMLALDGAYHGDTFGAMSIGQRGSFNRPFEHLFFDVDFLDFPSAQNEEGCLLAAEEKFKTGTFAAVIVEPLVQGSAGMRMYRPSFLNQLVALAKKHDVLVIFDEIMTGWGRTGRLFAMNYLQETPDIVCLSKGLTGGVLAMGLTVATNKIYEAFLDEDKTKALLHGHSYTANALACAAACANLDLIEDPLFFEDIDRISRAHTGLVNQLRGHHLIHDLRQTGTILAIELKTQDEQGGYFASIRDRMYNYFLDRKILLRPLGNVLFLNPPYCTTDEQLGYMYGCIQDFLGELEKEA